MSLSSAPLSPSLRLLLSSHGFVSASQVRQLSPSQLAAELSIPLLDALALLTALKPPQTSPSPQPPGNQHPPALAVPSHDALTSPPPPPASASQLLPSPAAAFPTALSLFARRCGVWTEGGGAGGGAAGAAGEAGDAAVNGGVVPGGRVASSVFTLCQRLDGLLGDGVQLGELTEFCGAPGLGKTQLAVQLAVATSIPAALGGVEGEAVYIDTEGSFVASRARDIAQGLQSHLDKLSRKRGSGGAAAAELSTPSVESMLRGIYVFRVFDVVEQLSVIRCLPHFLATHPQVRLLVVDSIAFHFRRGFDGDFSSRARLLASLAQQLLQLAARHQLAVVAINQVTTRIGGGGGEGTALAADGGGGSGGLGVSGAAGGGVLLGDASASLAPALGESWSHACTSRVLLFWKGSERWARIIKSPSRKQAACRYTISRDGIRDVRAHTTTPAHSSSTAQQQPPHVHKAVEQPSSSSPLSTALLHSTPPLEPPPAKRLAVQLSTPTPPQLQPSAPTPARA